MRDGLGHRAPLPATLVHLLLVGFEHEDQRTFRTALVVAMDPDARSERVIEPELVAVYRVDLAPEAQSERAGARGGPVGATVQAQRIRAGLRGVGQPQELEVLLRPEHPSVSRALPAVSLAGVEHPPVVFEAPHRLIGIADHAEDVVEFEHGTSDRRPSLPARAVAASLPHRTTTASVSSTGSYADASSWRR